MDGDRYQISTKSGADDGDGVDGRVLMARIGNTMWSILDEVCSADDMAFALELVDMANRGHRNLTHDAVEIADWIEEHCGSMTARQAAEELRREFGSIPDQRIMHIEDVRDGLAAASIDTGKAVKRVLNVVKSVGDRKS